MKKLFFSAAVAMILLSGCISITHYIDYTSKRKADVRVRYAMNKKLFPGVADDPEQEANIKNIIPQDLDITWEKLNTDSEIGVIFKSRNHGKYSHPEQDGTMGPFMPNIEKDKISYTFLAEKEGLNELSFDSNNYDAMMAANLILIDIYIQPQEKSSARAEIRDSSGNLVISPAAQYFGNLIHFKIPALYWLYNSEDYRLDIYLSE